MDLDSMTHDQLDDLAAERGIDPYPTSGVKAEKVAAIRDADLPDTCRAVANVPLSGWRRGEIRVVPVDGQLLRRAANGLVSVLETIDRPDLDGPVDLDAPAAGADLDEASDVLAAAVDEGRDVAAGLSDALFGRDDANEAADRFAATLGGEDGGEDGPGAGEVAPDGDVAPPPLS